MLSLLKSLGILWPPYGPPAGSEKQPMDVKPRVAVTVLEEEASEVVVIRVVAGAIVEVVVIKVVVDVVEVVVIRVVVGGVVVGGVVETDEEVILGAEELLLLVEDEVTYVLDVAARLLYICKRRDPPHYITVST